MPRRCTWAKLGNDTAGSRNRRRPLLAAKTTLDAGRLTGRATGGKTNIAARVIAKATTVGHQSLEFDRAVA